MINDCVRIKKKKTIKISIQKVLNFGIRLVGID